MRTEIKELQMQDCNQLGMGDGQSIHTAPSWIQWEHHTTTVGQRDCRDTTQNDHLIENRLTWSENIHEKENNIKIYIFSRE